MQKFREYCIAIGDGFYMLRKVTLIEKFFQDKFIGYIDSPGDYFVIENIAEAIALYKPFKDSLSDKEKRKLEIIRNDDIIQFGIYTGTPYADIRESYIMYFIQSVVADNDFTILNIYKMIQSLIGNGRLKKIAEQNISDKLSEKVANVGDRMQMFLRCDSVVMFDRRNNYQNKYEKAYNCYFRDRKGNIFKYMGTVEFQEGKYYDVVVTIKKHLNEDGIICNQINRPKVKQVISKDEPK